VRIRSDHSLSATILGEVNTGDSVWLTGASVEADGYVWSPVTVKDNPSLAGWTAAMYFEKPGGTTGWVRGTAVYVNDNDVNIRSGAGLSFGILTTLDAGEDGIVNDGPREANGYAWYNVTISGITGWMAADFLAEGDGGSPAPNPGTGEFGLGAPVRPTSDLNLRSGAGTDNPVIAVYGIQDTATVTDGPVASGGYTWYEVEMWDDNKVGWFAGEFLQVAVLEPTGTRHRVTDGPLTFRESPGLDGRVIGYFDTGTVFVIADASFASVGDYTWAYVYAENKPGTYGYVALGFSKQI
jgi:uncharacterized protein YgiM (DUF1202 family)